MLLHRKLLNFKSQSIEKYLRIVQNFMTLTLCALIISPSQEEFYNSLLEAAPSCVASQFMANPHF